MNRTLSFRTPRTLSIRTSRTRRLIARENNFSALNPTLWVNEALIQLPPRLMIAARVNRDFNPAVAQFGDVVNYPIPGKFEFNRKNAPCDPIVVQDMTGDYGQVALNQWPQVSFKICDGEFVPGADIIATIARQIRPAVNALALGIDRIVSGQVHNFIDNNVGRLGHIDATNVGEYIIDAGTLADELNWPEDERTMLLTARTKAAGLKAREFSDVSQSGSNQGVRNGVFDKAYGWNLMNNPSQPRVTAGQATYAVTVNNAGGYSAGATEIAFDGADAGDIAAGMWVSIDGDDTPQHITAVDTGVATITPGLVRAVADNADFTVVKGGLVNKAGGYLGTSTNPRRVGYAKEIVTDGWTSAPQIGQMVTFGAQTQRYSIIKLTIIDADAGQYGIMLDIPLVDSIADNATINPGPSGQYNFGFLPQAFTLVNRPPQSPLAGAGAVARTANDPDNKIALRVTIYYDGNIQAHFCTIDTFFGVGIVSTAAGLVMLG